jgi:hypothetical protein
MIVLRSSWSAFDTKDSTNGKKPIGTPRIQRLDSIVRKPKGNDVDSFNLCGDQATHFVSYTENPNAPNFSCNCKKKGNTFEVKPIMHVSSANERKTQVGWATIVRRKVGR